MTAGVVAETTPIEAGIAIEEENSVPTIVVAVEMKVRRDDSEWMGSLHVYNFYNPLLMILCVVFFLSGQVQGKMIAVDIVAVEVEAAVAEEAHEQRTEARDQTWHIQ